MKDFKPTEEKITLHGLGFLQLQLAANMRLHVWHPDLPRRHCFADSSIHDHRFNFTSQVLVGTQINRQYQFEHTTTDLSTHMAYFHEGDRTKFGNRPWVPDFQLVLMSESDVQVVPAGNSYAMLAYVFHSTEPGGDGRVATLMKKVCEGRYGAHSLCRVGVTPDVDFDRKQLSTARMWEFVEDVLGDVPVREIARTPIAPLEKIAPVQGYTPGIPWSLHLEAYDAYSKRWAPQPAMIDLEGRNCRGGFSTGELDQFIPGWRDRVSEIAKLRSRVAELEAQIANRGEAAR